MDLPTLQAGPRAISSLRVSPGFIRFGGKELRRPLFFRGVYDHRIGPKTDTSTGVTAMPVKGLSGRAGRAP